jgi:DNA (cytosine-5)-methyltransferase 1
LGGGVPDWYATEPDVGRVADGVAARVDRLKAIGNGQVPLCAATAWRLLTS